MKICGNLCLKMYMNPNTQREEDKAVHMIEQLLNIMPNIRSARILKEALENSDDEKEQIICDYIAGMTDSYAVKNSRIILCAKHGKFKK